MSNGSAPDFPGFGYRRLGRARTSVSAIGLADAGMGFMKGPSYEVYQRGFEKGINLFLWTPRFKELTRFFLDLPVEKRSRLFIVAGSGGGGPTHIRKVLLSYLKTLGLNKLSCFMLFWVRSNFRVRESIVKQMMSLRDEGLCDNIGLSIHKRTLAYDLYLKDIFDIFMLRYNAAHRGLERDFLDKVDPDKLPGIISYTATRWRSLLQRPRGWDEALPRPGDCYRFPLSHPRVTATWMSPNSVGELEANLSVVAEGPLKPEEAAFICRFGDIVHAQRTPLFGNFFEQSAKV